MWSTVGELPCRRQLVVPTAVAEIGFAALSTPTVENLVDKPVEKLSKAPAADLRITLDNFHTMLIKRYRTTTWMHVSAVAGCNLAQLGRRGTNVYKLRRSIGVVQFCRAGMVIGAPARLSAVSAQVFDLQESGCGC